MNKLETLHLSAHGWTENGQMVRMELAFPGHIEDLFVELDNSQDEDANNEQGLDNVTDVDE